MIEDKIVKIYKDNKFDKGWLLFVPYREAITKNIRYECVSISDVVKKITYATEILLILHDICLPRKVVEELIWVNKYIKLSIVAKSSKILEKYSDLKFSKVTVDEKVGVNYISIERNNIKNFYIFNDEINTTDDTIEKVLLGRNPGKKYEWLTGVQEVFVVEEKGQLEHKDLLDLCFAKKIKTSYVCNIANYNKSIYDALAKTTIKILVAKILKNAVVFVRDNRLYSVNELWGSEVITEIADINYCIQSDLFESMKLKESLFGGEIPGEAYYIDNTKMSLLTLSEKFVIERKVEGLTMKDFLEENFDRSETSNHNDYCLKAKRVEYRFTLVPPIFDSSYSYSSIYKYANRIYAKWKENFSIDFSALENDVKEFGSFQTWNNFITLLKEINEYLSWTVTNYEYSRYPILISNYINKLKFENETLLEKFLQLHNSIAGEYSITQYSKFDEEIAGYKRTIVEKQLLVDQGKDILYNKRRIEILEKKIEDLLLLRRRFELKASDRTNEGQKDFINKYNVILNGKAVKAEVDSVSNVIVKGELTKTSKLNLFLDKWIVKLNLMLENSVAILEELCNVDVPENYVVYDKGGKRYIIIDQETEYQMTFSLCEKYKMECITRR